MEKMLTMVMVSEMDRSVRFYRDTLGLKLRFQSPAWTEFEVDGTTLALHGGSFGSGGGTFSTPVPLSGDWASRLTMDAERVLSF